MTHALAGLLHASLMSARPYMYMRMHANGASLAAGSLVDAEFSVYVGTFSTPTFM